MSADNPLVVMDDGYGVRLVEVYRGCAIIWDGERAEDLGRSDRPYTWMEIDPGDEPYWSQDDVATVTEVRALIDKRCTPDGVALRRWLQGAGLVTL